ncbi:terpene synthase family protein [Actinomadura flavalba]|uniref:terpene synthase family protein n=1 Tax=Actinomadura flavalba TaxID=1120938 RepID=UPI00036FFF3D|nr:terpene synthase family protein [Actinomadura flavalba]
MNVTLLHSLTDRVAAQAPASGLHADVRALGERVDGWARGRGLLLGDPDACALGRARFGRLAARIFPAADPGRVELFGRWLTWTFALDDVLDADGLGGSANAVHILYGDLLAALRRGRARPGARPLEAALLELWDATGAGMSREWRRRFLAHMEDHRTGCAQEAVHRRLGEMPTLAEFPALRRRACGPFLADLVEPVLGVELPLRVLATPLWKDLVEASADMVAWSNDLASHVAETARGDVHDHVTVMNVAYGFTSAQSEELVADRVALRGADLAESVRTLPAATTRLGLDETGRASVLAVADALHTAPRAHLEWLTESGRYAAPAARPPSRLDALASLR